MSGIADVSDNMKDKKLLSLREVQLRELNILLDIDKFCKENGIRYALDSGTLLGAIRHHGFIVCNYILLPLIKIAYKIYLKLR